MWSAQFVETIGCALTSLAASILVYRQTGGSALSVALMLIASAAPSLLMGLVAGVFVDRYDRRRIMITADVLRAALVLLIPFLAPYSIAWLYVIVLVTSAIGQFFDPAWESVLPEAAPDEELAAANSLMAISTFGSTAIGFAASGLIASSTSIDYAFYLNPFAYFFSAACIFFISVEKVGIAERTSVAVAVRVVPSPAAMPPPTPPIPISPLVAPAVLPVQEPVVVSAALCSLAAAVRSPTSQCRPAVTTPMPSSSNPSVAVVVRVVPSTPPVPVATSPPPSPWGAPEAAAAVPAL